MAVKDNLPHLPILESHHGISQNQRYTPCERTAWTQKHRKHPDIHAIEKALFEADKADEYHVKVAHNVEEALKLVEVGFEDVTGEYHDGGKIFRKRR